MNRTQRTLTLTISCLLAIGATWLAAAPALAGDPSAPLLTPPLRGPSVGLPSLDPPREPEATVVRELAERLSTPGED